MADLFEDYDYTERETQENPQTSFHFSAVLALALFVSSYMLSDSDGRAEYALQKHFFQSTGILIIGIIIGMWSWCKMKSKIGILPNLYHSTLVQPIWRLGETEKIRFRMAPGVAKCMISAGFMFIAHTLNTFVSYYDDDFLKHGSIDFMIYLVGAFIVIITYFMLKFSYTLSQVFGISLSITGSIWFFMTLDMVKHWHLIILQILSVICYTASVILLLLASKKELGTHTGGIIQLFIQGLLQLFSFVVFYLFLTSAAISASELIIEIISGCLFGLGIYFMTESLMKDNPGISINIVLLRGIFYGFLISESYEAYNIVPFSTCMVGLFFMIFGDFIFNKFSCRLNKSVLKHRSSITTPLLKDNL